jgi:hypothetical protein
MNVETMSTRATLALAAMAAKSDNMVGSVPSDDSVATIDDILSMSTKIEFFGKKTKTYTNSKDEKSGSFCTIPVKYEFSDRDTRFEAEKFLRSKCGAHCTTPYPTILRECIRQTADQIRKKYPGNQVKVIVDADKFCLKAAKREQPMEEDGDGGAAGNGAGMGAGTGTASRPRWEYFSEPIPLPPEALNIIARKVPDGFLMPIPELSVRKHVNGGAEGAIEADTLVRHDEL